MIQRVSGYDKIEGETYITPKWVYDALQDEFPAFEKAKDPFPANSKIDAFKMRFPRVFATNPPFTKADLIVNKAMDEKCVFALLLPATWDCAKSRKGVCEAMWAKIVLTRRIRWENLEQKKNGPSSNHAWYIWDGYSDTWQKGATSPYLIYV